MKNDFKLISSEGDFSLYVANPIYKTYVIENGYIRNTKTGENCGKKVELRKIMYDGLKQLDTFVYEEDCYEFVFEGERQ